MNLLNRNHVNRKIGAFLEKGVVEGVYPGAVLLVSKDGQVVSLQEVGHLSTIPEQVPMTKDTIFDLASLTKPLATTLALMKLVDNGEIKLDQPLSELLTTSALMDKKDLTIRLILSHSAGFVDWKPLYIDLVKYEPDERKSVLREWLVKEPFDYEPGKGCVYSDLGFMFLEWVIENISGMAMHQFLNQNFYKPLMLERTFLGAEKYSMGFKKEVFAATEECPWRKRVIQGEVHDENAFALGGYSGHAGLFGDANGVFVLVNMLREHYRGERDDYLRPETVKKFFQRQDIFESSTWALGWDTPSLRDSSSGKYFTKNSVGHLGFAGTSVWMDLEKDIVVIFLSNRVHTTRDNLKIRAFRPKLHDLIMEELGKAATCLARPKH
jgi:CubicO group peptidase (beta-lactamase class C family)